MRNISLRIAPNQPGQRPYPSAQHNGIKKLPADLFSPAAVLLAYMYLLLYLCYLTRAVCVQSYAAFSQSVCSSLLPELPIDIDDLGL